MRSRREWAFVVVFLSAEATAASLLAAFGHRHNRLLLQVAEVCLAQAVIAAVLLRYRPRHRPYYRPRHRPGRRHG